MRSPVCLLLALASLPAACGTPPESRSAPDPTASVAAETEAPDPCATVETAPDEARELGAFQGLLRGVRCRAELFAVMKRTAGALGVACTHCHVAGDYAAATSNKRAANWMAHFARGLRVRGGGAVSCADCHASGGEPRLKLLGEPRSRSQAVEWMTTVLVERFETASGAPLYCRSCHAAGLGDPGFSPSVIGTEHVPPEPPATPREHE